MVNYINIIIYSHCITNFKVHFFNLNMNHQKGKNEYGKTDKYIETMK